MSPWALKSAVKPLQGESLSQYQLDRFGPKLGRIALYFLPHKILLDPLYPIENVHKIQGTSLLRSRAVSAQRLPFAPLSLWLPPLIRIPTIGISDPLNMDGCLGVQLFCTLNCFRLCWGDSTSPISIWLADGIVALLAAFYKKVIAIFLVTHINSFGEVTLLQTRSPMFGIQQDHSPSR